MRGTQYLAMRETVPWFAHLLSRRGGLHLYRIALRPLHVFAAPAIPGIRTGVMSESQLQRFGRDPALELPAPLVRAALARGDVCVGAWERDALVGYQWLAFSAAPHVDGIWVHFGERDCYAYKKLVLPAWRGRRIAIVLSALADAVAAARGRTRMISLIALDNTSSWKASQRTGNATAGYAGYLRCFGMNIAFHSEGARREGLALFTPSLRRLPVPETA